MTRFLRASAVSVVCTIGAIAVSHAQTVTCQNAQYSPELLTRFPNLAQACSSIVQKGGEDYAVVKARLDRINASGTVQVRVKQADGSYSKQVTIKPKSDLRVQVNGKPVQVRDLATGQEITAYVKVREPVMALAPAEESAPIEPTPIEEPEQMAAALPATASMLPLLGLLGGVSMLFGGFLTLIRYRRR
jgi:hypothetical protein